MTSEAKAASDMTPEEFKTFNLWLRDMLKVGPLTVTFTKRDGTERVMRCTLCPEMLPPVVVTEDAEPKKQRTVNEDVMAVYDLEAKGWRSFTLMSVTRVSLTFNRSI
jgi:hypothetical protein